jgi:hypothetical protein
VAIFAAAEMPSRRKLDWSKIEVLRRFRFLVFRLGLFHTAANIVLQCGKLRIIAPGHTYRFQVFKRLGEGFFFFFFCLFQRLAAHGVLTQTD